MKFKKKTFKMIKTSTNAEKKIALNNQYISVSL